jgi:hypothetical protein
VGSTNATNTTNATGTLTPTDVGVAPYVNLQRSLATAAMVFGVFYFPTAVTRNAMYDESSVDALDVVTAQLYRSTTGFAIVSAAALVSLVGPTSTGGAVAACGIVTAAAVWCLLCSLLYGRVANPQEGDFTTYRLLSRFKKVAYAAASVGAACSLAVAIRAHRHGQQRGTLVASPLNDAWAAWVCVGCAAFGVVVVPLLEFIARNAPCAFIACFGSATAAPLSPFESTVDRARRLLLQLEQQLADAGCMGAAWLQQRGAWRRRVESATRLSTVAAATIYVEASIRTTHLNAPFLRARAAWLTEIKGLVDPVDDEDATTSVAVVVQGMYANSGRGWCNSSCECCSCDSGDSDAAARRRRQNENSGGRETDPVAVALMAEQSRHDTLIRVVQGIVNGVAAAEDEGAHRGEFVPPDFVDPMPVAAQRLPTKTFVPFSVSDDDSANSHDDDGDASQGGSCDEMQPGEMRPRPKKTRPQAKAKVARSDAPSTKGATRQSRTSGAEEDPRSTGSSSNAPFGDAVSPHRSRRASGVDHDVVQTAEEPREGHAFDRDDEAGGHTPEATPAGGTATAATAAIADAEAADIAAALELGVDDGQW